MFVLLLIYNCLRCLEKHLVGLINIDVVGGVNSSSNFFLNVLMTDLRSFGVEQKSKSFYSIVEKTLSINRKINIVVPLVGSNLDEVVRCYRRAFGKYLDHDCFNIVFLKKTSAFRFKAIVSLLTIPFFLISLGGMKSRFNLSCVSSLGYLRLLSYYKIYDLMPCDNWIGLTGNIELLAMCNRRNISGSRTKVYALQFGQAALDQLHFKNYSVDCFFTYDDPSRQIYEQLGVDCSSVVVSGSPEFEYGLSLIKDIDDLSDEKTNILFIDQPVQVRPEYAPEYLDEVYDCLVELSLDTRFDFSVKKHPRGSAFGNKDLKSFNKSDNIYELLSESHIVVSFFSNLSDLALLKNRMTICLRADQVLSSDKIKWMISHGCVIVDSLSDLRREVHGYIDNDFSSIKSDTEIMNASDVIISRMIQ